MIVVVSPLRGLAVIIRVKDKTVEAIDKIFATEEGKIQELGFHSNLLWECALSDLSSASFFHRNNDLF